MLLSKRQNQHLLALFQFKVKPLNLKKAMQITTINHQACRQRFDNHRPEGNIKAVKNRQFHLPPLT
jgi:hypothetical protein